jgi:hypothetical protein
MAFSEMLPLDRSLPFHPQMEPSSEANKKLAFDPFESRNPVVLLKIVPVGWPVPVPLAAGIVALN